VRVAGARHNDLGDDAVAAAKQFVTNHRPRRQVREHAPSSIESAIAEIARSGYPEATSTGSACASEALGFFVGDTVCFHRSKGVTPFHLRGSQRQLKEVRSRTGCGLSRTYLKIVERRSLLHSKTGRVRKVHDV
jgi:hypothetical protein